MTAAGAEMEMGRGGDPQKRWKRGREKKRNIYTYGSRYSPLSGWDAQVSRVCGRVYGPNVLLISLGSVQLG
jgi:hypothetical protein